MGDAWKILQQDVSDDYLITVEQEEMIFAWDEFRQATNIGVIGFPIWLNSFGVNFEDDDLFHQEQGYEGMPNWKKRFVDNNRKLYIDNRDFIDDWIVRYDMFNRIKLFQKFEWNCGIDVNDIHNTIIQIRQSGIRVKRPTYYPSLVAMVNTPIIWDRQKQHFRHITQREAANLQNFHGKFKFTRNDKAAYKQLGNSVNVRVLKILGEQLFALANEGWEDEKNE